MRLFREFLDPMFVQKQVTEDLKAIWEQLQYRGSAGRLVKMVK